jgi:tetratricopeptide (TPR) repeat protein
MQTPAQDRLEAEIAAVYAARDRDDMQPTVDAFEAMLAADPGNPRLVYEVAGAYDTAGDEARAAGLYERALRDGLEGDARVRCLLQYGSTLRNLGRHVESIDLLQDAVHQYPDSVPLRIWLALSLHAGARSDRAVADLLDLAADLSTAPDLDRYRPALRGNAEYLRALDASGR